MFLKKWSLGLVVYVFFCHSTWFLAMTNFRVIGSIAGAGRGDNCLIWSSSFILKKKRFTQLLRKPTTEVIHTGDTRSNWKRPKSSNSWRANIPNEKSSKDQHTEHRHIYYMTIICKYGPISDSFLPIQLVKHCTSPLILSLSASLCNSV